MPELPKTLCEACEGSRYADYAAAPCRECEGLGVVALIQRNGRRRVRGALLRVFGGMIAGIVLYQLVSLLY